MLINKHTLLMGLYTKMIYFLCSVALGAWENFDTALKTHVQNGVVDYEGLRKTQALTPEVLWLSTTKIPVSPQEQKAFWINAYNLLTLDLIVDHPQISSIRELHNGEPWKKESFVVSGQPITLDEIEHKILRPLGDPRIHAAINCASKGCPPLQSFAYQGNQLNTQLDIACRNWMATNAYFLSTSQLQLNSIFDWFKEDFSAYREPIPKLNKGMQGVVGFIIAYSDGNIQKELREGDYKITFSEYDWLLNGK